MAPELLGSETPRIFTPPLRELTPLTSLGFEAIQFAEDPDLLNMRLTPWQKWLFTHGLELADGYTTRDRNPPYRFDTVVVIVSRQNGKTECIKVKKLWKMFLDGARETLATSQDLGNAEKTWSQTIELIKDVPELGGMIEHVNKVNGQKSLRLTNMAQYLVRAKNSAPRGMSIDDLDLDELLKHKTWDAWAASTPTTLARPRSQVWCWSSAGDADSIVLWQLRAAALLTAVGVDDEEREWFTRAVDMAGPVEVDGDELELGESLALFEWSAHPSAALNDPVGRAQANPSLGHGFMTTRKLSGLIRGMPSEWNARQEFLCQWRPTGAGGPFPEGAWDEGVDDDSDWAPDADIAVALAMTEDRSMTYVAMVGLRADGDVHGEISTMRPGLGWAEEWLTSPDRESRSQWVAVTWVKSGAPESELTEKLPEGGEHGLPIVETSTTDLAVGCGQLYDLVRLPKPDEVKRQLRHVRQPALDVPATTASTRPQGQGAWVFDRRRIPDPAPLVALAAAVRALSAGKKPVRSAYDDESASVVIV